jgi:hypothetical protein
LIRAASSFDLIFALEQIGKIIGLGLPSEDIVERMDPLEKAKMPRRGPTSSAIQAMYALYCLHLLHHVELYCIVDYHF